MRAAASSRSPRRSAPAELARQALAGLRRLVAHYDRPDDGLSRPAQAPGRLAGRLRSPGAARRMDRLSAAPASRPPPTPEQRRAADPPRSVWVTANAGTGKTRVLADRVLRLLLAGADPESILCLTFTKAAAAEMVSGSRSDLAAGPPSCPRPSWRRSSGSSPGAPPDAERARTARGRCSRRCWTCRAACRS